MRLLANENIPLAAVRSLQEYGDDVLWIRENAPGSADDDVLALASEEDRILLTFAKDFGELAFRSGLPARCGIVFVSYTDAICRIPCPVYRQRDGIPIGLVWPVFGCGS